MPRRLAYRCGLAALGLLLLAARPAAAQATGGTIITGPIGWTPSLRVTNLGFDTNIYNDPPGREVEDVMGTITPQIDGVFNASRLRVQGSAVHDFVYFDRYESERAINRRYNARGELQLGRVQPNASFGYERVSERQGPEVDIRASRRETSTTVGVSLFVITRGALQLSARHAELRYDELQSFRGQDIAENLDRDVQTGSVGLRFALTPLTAMIVDASLGRERFVVAREKDTESRRASVAFEFSPDAVIRGRATLGYHILEIADPLAVSFEGLTADVDISYLLLGVTRFDGRYSRDTAASIEAPYYLQERVGLEIQQGFIGPFDLLVRGSREYLDYPGIPGKNFDARRDHVDAVAGGMLVRLSDRSSITSVYELSYRRSTLENYRYDRRRLITALLLGF
jgi:hypothetical protein